MDSLRVPSKGSGSGSLSKVTKNVPLGIKFNVGDESVEDVLKPDESPLSSSPPQNSEDFSWRKDFLQGSFFNRKRSGSIEGSSSPGSGLLSISDTNTVGTWKLIKGKVSQAMEDIKSSKASPQTTSKAIDCNDDSDVDNTTVNSSISDELPLDHFVTSIPALPGCSIGIKSASSIKTITNTSNCHQTDSDSDIDDIFQTGVDDSEFAIRKSIATLRSKTKSNNPIIKNVTFDDTPSNPPITVLNIKSNPMQQESSRMRCRLRRRRKLDNNTTTKDVHPPQSEDPAVSLPIITPRKVAMEIESGIEVLEDMLLPANLNSERNSTFVKVFERNDNITLNENTATFQKKLESLMPNIPYSLCGTINHTSTLTKLKTKDENYLSASWISIIKHYLLQIIRKLYTSWIFYVILISLIIILVFPISQFSCGAATTCIAYCSYKLLQEIACSMIEQHIGSGHQQTSFMPAEHLKFRISDYVCEMMPVIEEHKPLKSYAGWMNEIPNYDPSNYHISMTKSVYVRLDGSTLRLSSTSNRISKRSMWNEQQKDRKTIHFTKNRYFNLLGCRIEMSPKGLARKRHFSRKYPIQLFIKCNDSTIDSFGNMTSIRGQDNTIMPISTEMAKQDQPFPSTITHQSSNESNDDQSERNQLIDLQNDVDTDMKQVQESLDSAKYKDSTPCQLDETSIFLFARCDREKEDCLKELCIPHDEEQAWIFPTILAKPLKVKIECEQHNILRRINTPTKRASKYNESNTPATTSVIQYRRFLAASQGDINDLELHIPDIIVVSNEEVASAPKTTVDSENSTVQNSPPEDKSISSASTEHQKNVSVDCSNSTNEDSSFIALLISSCSARSPPDYIHFMSKFQKGEIKPTNSNKFPMASNKQRNKQKKLEDDLWKGFDQSLEPSGSAINILVGRILYSCLNDEILLEKIQEFLQKKMSAIRLPSFMEDVVIAQVNLGTTPPVIHRVHQPLLDERGIWVDADVTYDGLMHMTITTKLNLLRFKRQQKTTAPQSTQQLSSTVTSGTNDDGSCSSSTVNNCNSPLPSMDDVEYSSAMNCLNETTSSIGNCAIYDSNAESSGASSSESESPVIGTTDPINDIQQSSFATHGSSRRFLKMIGQITASNLFQSAAEISYIQRAMENMSPKITLRVELKGLVSRVLVNIPPPPTDRIWLSFRTPPKLLISAKPAVGDHTVDWTIVTNVIENKLCEEVNKYLVYPNMVDLIAPFLGQPTYKE